MHHKAILSILFLPLFAFASESDKPSELVRIVCASINAAEGESLDEASDRGRVLVLDQLDNQYTAKDGSLKEMSFEKLTNWKTTRSPSFPFSIKILECKIVETNKKYIKNEDVLSLDPAKVNKKISSKSCVKTKEYVGEAFRMGRRIVFKQQLDETHTYDMANKLDEYRGMAQISTNNNYTVGEEYTSLMCMKPTRVPSENKVKTKTLDSKSMTVTK